MTPDVLDIQGETAAVSVRSLLEQGAALATAELTASDAIKWGLDLVCTHVGWPLGHVFMPSNELDTLRASGIWHNEDPPRFAPLVDAFNAAEIRKGEGLIGRVFETGRAAWIDAYDPRARPELASAAVTVGLRAAFAFPILSDRGVEGVMQVISPERVELSEDQLALFAQVGLYVGRVIERRRSRAQLREAERLAHLGSWTWDLERDVIDCSPELFAMHGMKEAAEHGPPRDFGFEDFLAVIHPDDHGPLRRWVQERISTGQPGDIEYRVRIGRKLRWIFAHVEIAEWRGDKVVRLAGYDQDVTERRRVEERRRGTQRELAHQQRVLGRIARGEPLADTLVSLCRHVERHYPRARCSILLLDRTAGALRALAGPALPAAFHAAIDGLPVGDGVGACGTAAARREVVVIEDAVTHPHTAPFIELIEAHHLYSVWSQPLTRVSGEVLGTFAVYRDKVHRPSRAEIKFVTAAGSLAALAIERAQSEAELMKAANLDSLTALPNRARFLELVNHKLTEQPERRLSVMFLDLDRFKIINDTLGHPAGDRVLVEIAERLRGVVADHDDRALAARFGGDEFTMAVSDLNEDEVFALADRVREVIEKPFELDGGEFFLSLTTGIAVNDHPGDAYALVREADAAMYAAKGRGSGRREVYDRRLRTKMMARLERETRLRRALERDEMVLHYQPILSISPRRWVGVEALVRWQDPTRGLIFPGEFIPLAEETGLIMPLGTRVLELVAGQAAAWARALPEIHIAANASAVQLADPSLASFLIGLLAAYDVPPSAVSIEVTESAVMEEIESASEVLEGLSAAGVGVLIDDFGTGYSSIARLGELPIEGLKIDRRFIAGLGADPAARHVLAAIADLARAYGLQVVAEGIEDADALGVVARIGCHFAQGYHLGRPAPADVIELLLSQPPP